nr:apolipoprotein N-acyltransferase [Mesobaculum littorinae]
MPDTPPGSASRVRDRLSLRRYAGRQRLALAALAGVFAGLGQVPFSAVPVALAGLALSLGLLHGARTWRGAAALGFFAGTGYFATSLHWIVEPFLVDVARHGWMAPFGLFFTATGFALFWAVAFALARATGGRGWRLSLAWAVWLGAAEMTRSYILTGFPWALVGYVWTEGPALQLVSLIGPYGLTVLTLLLVAGGVEVARRRAWPTLVRLAVAAAVWLLPLGAGALLLHDDPPTPGAALVRIVQPNAPQDEKWDPERAGFFFQRMLEFTAAPGAPDLTIWPETSLPYYLEDGHAALARVSDAAGGRPVALGAQRVDGWRAWNSMALIEPGGRIADLYDKHHLVPFGEYVPLGGIGRALGLPSFAAEDGFGFTPGEGPHLVDTGAAGRVLPLICYEAIFPQDVNAAPGRPDWLMQITNDAWFGTFSGPYQHLAQARARAVEQGLPLIRSANTGISAVIDAAGRVTASLPLGEAGYLDARLPPARAATPYAQSGDLPLALLLTVLAVGIWLTAWRDRR